MSAATLADIESVQVPSQADDGARLARRRFTASDYLKMAERGIFAPNEKLELIDGDIVKKMSPIGTPHLWCVNRITQLFVMKFAGRAFVSPQNPLTLDDYNEPEPDVVLLPLMDARQRPTAKDALLVVEVSDSSLKADRQLKAPLYAAFGIAELWLVDLTNQRIEAYRDPKGNAYRQILIFDETQNIAPLKFPNDFFSVAEILGAKPLSLSRNA